MKPLTMPFGVLEAIRVDDGLAAKRAAPKAYPTVGFGCPATVDPHHVVVRIPRGRDEPVLVVETFGMRAGHAGLPDTIERVELDRAKWTAIADPMRRVFNERLREKGHAASRWTVGDNRVARLLGKELLVLAWAIEKAPLEHAGVAAINWSGLKPEERWWLFTMTAAASGGVDDGEVGWRKALRFALTENPVSARSKASAPKKINTGSAEESHALTAARHENDRLAEQLLQDAPIAAAVRGHFRESKGNCWCPICDLARAQAKGGEK